MYSTYMPVNERSKRQNKIKMVFCQVPWSVELAPVSCGNPNQTIKSINYPLWTLICSPMSAKLQSLCNVC